MTLETDERLKFLQLRNRRGFGADIATFGAAVSALWARDRQGELRNIAAGYGDLWGFLRNDYNFGATVGRVANRIAGGRFELDGKPYQLEINDSCKRRNALHGGVMGYARLPWNIAAFDGRVAELKLHSADGDSGYPGAVEVTARYEVTDDDALIIDYLAVPDRPTVINLTNHTYFNLNGEGEPSCAGHEFRLAASRRVAINEEKIPTGELSRVDDSVYDLRAGKSFEDILSGLPGGFDDCFVIDAPGMECPAAAVEAEPSGIRLELYTDLPGVQFCMCSYLDGRIVGRSGRGYERNSAFCLEAQYFPDSPNHAGFPSIRFTPQNPFHSRTIYRLGVKNDGR